MSVNKVSIIMPCHNGERFLDYSIQSVLDQTYDNWELLIIDDHSTDNSVEVINKYCERDSRIKLFHTEKSIGLPSAPRNVGIKNAQGRFIAFLDCDDIWLPNKLENQVPYFNNIDYAVVFSYYKKINEDGATTGRTIKSPDSVSYKELLKGDCIGNLTGIYDTMKVGKVYQKDTFAEDYLMWLDILNKGFKAKNTNTLEAYYRTFKKSLSANKLKSLQWTWNIYSKELKLNPLVCMYNFSHYAIKGILKLSK